MIFLQILWSIEKNILNVLIFSEGLENKHAFLISFLAANHERQLKSPNSINYFDFALTLKLPGVKP